MEFRTFRGSGMRPVLPEDVDGAVDSTVAVATAIALLTSVPCSWGAATRQGFRLRRPTSAPSSDRRTTRGSSRWTGGGAGGRTLGAILEHSAVSGSGEVDLRWAASKDAGDVEVGDGELPAEQVGGAASTPSSTRTAGRGFFGRICRAARAVSVRSRG